MIFFFFKQKTAYEMRISDWSSDVCSSDLDIGRCRGKAQFHASTSSCGRVWFGWRRRRHRRTPQEILRPAGETRAGGPPVPVREAQVEIVERADRKSVV